MKKMFYLMSQILKPIWAFVERHLVLCGVLVLLIFGGSFKLGFFDFMKKSGKTNMEVSMRGSKKIDTLFTSFAYVPIIVFKDKFTLFSDNPNMADGYCLRRYEVGLGYKNIYEIFKKYENDICQNGNIENLPNPQIISTNPVSSEIYGKYTRSECDSYDIKETNGPKSDIEIRSHIYQNYGNSFLENSKNMLMTFLKNYCPNNIQTSQNQPKDNL